MTIAAVRALPVNVPMEAPYRWSAGVFPGFTHTIVEVKSAEGAVGLGETWSPADARLVEEAIGPRLVDADPRDLAACERRALPSARGMRTTHDLSLLRAWGGVETALWDLAGKLEGRSVASLLGGRVRDAVPFTEYFAFRVGREETPTEVAAYCARMAEEHASPAFEGKVGVADLAAEVELVREVRAAIGGEALLRVDANMRWSVPRAHRALARFAEHGVTWCEEPVASFEELARLRRTTPVSFSSHEPDLRTAARLGVPDAFVVNIAALGGIRRTVSFAAACAELGFDVWFWSPDSGVGTAAILQVAAAAETLTEPSQTILRWHADDVVAEEPFRPEGGLVPVPDGPGLGVTLDREALERCHRRFREEGPYDHYSYGAPSRKEDAWTLCSPKVS